MKSNGVYRTGQQNMLTVLDVGKKIDSGSAR